MGALDHLKHAARSTGRAATLLLVSVGFATASDLASYQVTGDAIIAPLGGRVGDPIRGRQLVLDRERGNCLICHQVRVDGQPFQGDLAPPLDGVGRRLSPGQIRLRLVDQSRLNRDTVMPPYHRLERLTRVAAQYQGRPVFSAQDIEDAVAWLDTLKE